MQRSIKFIQLIEMLCRGALQSNFISSALFGAIPQKRLISDCTHHHIRRSNIAPSRLLLGQNVLPIVFNPGRTPRFLQSKTSWRAFAFFGHTVKLQERSFILHSHVNFENGYRCRCRGTRDFESTVCFFFATDAILERFTNIVDHQQPPKTIIYNGHLHHPSTTTNELK